MSDPRPVVRVTADPDSPVLAERRARFVATISADLERRPNNIYRERGALIEPYIEWLSSHPEVSAVMQLGGGQGYRRYADQASDIDIAVFLDLPDIDDDAAAAWHQGDLAPARRHFPTWLPNYKFKVPNRPDIPNVSVFQLALQLEATERWGIQQTETYIQTGTIVRMRAGDAQVPRFLAGKRRNAFVQLARKAFTFSTMLEITGKDTGIGVARNHLRGAAENVRTQVSELVDATYLVNGVLPPSVKWRLDSARHLVWQPPFFQALLDAQDRPMDTADCLHFMQHRLQLAGASLRAELNTLGIVGPSDGYSHIMVEEKHRQLLPRTQADSVLGTTGELPAYDSRLRTHAWNAVNWHVAQPARATDRPLEPPASIVHPRLDIAFAGEAEAVLRSAGANLREAGAAPIAAGDFTALTGTAELRELAQAWDDLQPDQHMADGGGYRWRRYGRLLARPVDGAYELTPLPAGEFTQSKDVIPLYQGARRRFAQISQDVLQSRALAAPILFDLDVIAAAQDGRREIFTVGLHMIRVVAEPDSANAPAPEGRHFDGHAFVGMHLVDRRDVTGGQSRVYRPEAETAFVVHTMTKPGEGMVIDDRRVHHEVTPVSGAQRTGRRDMLLLDFNGV